VAKEIYSTTISIVTIRSAKHDLRNPSNFLVDPAKIQASYWQRAWKEGIWTIQATDYTKLFPRFLGNVSTYTPLPPLEGQNPAYLRLLIHKGEDSDAAEYAVDSKLSTNGSLIRISQLGWKKYLAKIPKNVPQVVVCASGVTGIAPMLQTIHTLLETGRWHRKPEAGCARFMVQAKPGTSRRKRNGFILEQLTRRMNSR